MDDDLVRFAVILLIAIVAYIALVTWRVRVHREKKRRNALESADGSASSAAGTAPAADRILSRLAGMRPEGDTAGTTAESTTASAIVDRPPASTPTTVAHLVQGIALPHDLAPLVDLTARPGAGDRVAFWTDHASAEAVHAALTDELRRLDFEIEARDDLHSVATRRNDRLVVLTHPDGQRATIDGRPAFPTVPVGALVVELYVG